MKWVIVAVLVLVVIGGGGYWVMQSRKAEVGIPEKDWNQQQQAAQPSNAPVVTGPTAGQREFTVEGSSFAFEPSQIKVKKGDTVRLTFKSDDGTHDLVIDELGVVTNQIGEGEEEEVEFVADKAGTFEYYCSVANHRAMGMIGKLVVE